MHALNWQNIICYACNSQCSGSGSVHNPFKPVLCLFRSTPALRLPFLRPFDGVAVGQQLHPQATTCHELHSNARPLLPAQLPIAYSYIDIWLGGAVELQNRLVMSACTGCWGLGRREPIRACMP